MIEVCRVLFWLAAGLIVYTYAGYPLLLLVWQRLCPEKPVVLQTALPGVSIVIAAYNEEDVIRKRIENCLALDYPLERLEIIIASDGSDDATNSIVREYADAGVTLHDYPQRQGKVNVLNATVPLAKFDIVVFSDANTMFQPDALQKLVRHFGRNEVGCVCGRLKFVNAQGSRTGELEGVYWRFETLLKRLEGGRGSLLGANGAIYAVRKELFYGCPADTIVEDFVIPMKILERGYAVWYEPEAIAIEETAKHIIHEKERRIRIGAGDFQALWMLWHLLDPRRGFPALAFWSHKVFRWFVPFLMVLAFVTNACLHDQPFYLFLLAVQYSFYGAAFVGQMLSWSGIHLRFFSLCYYFVSMNLAILLGFFRFIAGAQRVTWQRTQR